MTASKPEPVKCKPGIICVRHQGYNCMCRCHVVERVAEPVSDPKLETRNWKQRAQVAETEVERLKAELAEAKDKNVRLQQTLALHEGPHVTMTPERADELEGASERENQLREALERIASWEMPPVFDREGNPSRMSLEYGSNGERDYIRSVARAALSPIPTDVLKSRG